MVEILLDHSKWIEGETASHSLQVAIRVDSASNASNALGDSQAIDFDGKDLSDELLSLSRGAGNCISPVLFESQAIRGLARWII